MNSLLPKTARGGHLSVAVLLLLIAQQSCFQVEMTTTMEPDGSGQLALDMNVSRALLELGQQSGEVDTDELDFDEEDIADMRAAADTIPGLHFDTAYRVQDPERLGLHAEFRFDSVGVIRNMVETQEPGEMSLPRLQQTGRQVRLSYLPAMDFGSETETDSPFGEMGRQMALKMIDMRFRYVFPQGTTVDTASPGVRRTDSTVVYEVGIRDVVNASENQDSLFVSAQLPSTGPGLTFYMLIGVLLLLGAGVTLLLRKRTG